MYRTVLAALMPLVLSVSSPAATFDVRDHGAVGDGVALDTKAIQTTLDACAAAGGGNVVVPPGTYLCGRVVIPSHVTVELQAGATIQGSSNPEDYAGGSTIFHARGAERIAIVGRGTIRGIGEADLGRRPNTNDKDNWPEFRAGILRMEDCRDVTLRDFRILFSDTWTVLLYRCDNVVIDGLAIRNNYFRTNSDGIDPVSCRNCIGSA